MIGSHLGERYQLTVLVQEGPIFTAYSARDKVLGRDVIVRIIRPPFSAEEPFLQAVQEVIGKAGSVSNSNVEKVLELQQAKDVQYLICETSRGSGLTERIRKLAPYSAAVSVSMVISILEGLEAIHNSGFIHGDAGSHNIVVQADGIARLELAGMWEAYAASQTGSVVMLPLTAPYISPEVAAGGPHTKASDTYAIGVILFQLLTGRLPFQGDTPVATAMKHTSAPIPSVRAVNPGLPTSLEDFLQKALAKDPALRFANASTMLNELHKIESNVRFGKPVAPVPAPAAVQTKPVATAAPKKEPVPKKEPTPKKEPVPAREPDAVEPAQPRHNFVDAREPRDVPIWLAMFATFCIAIVVALVGFWIYLIGSSPKSVTVPDLRGKPRESALQTLANLKLQMRVGGQETSEKVPLDSVVDLDPSPGQLVKEGGVVTVRISSGSKLVTLPDLRGKSVEEVRDILANLTLDLDRTDPIPDPKIPSGMVVRQTPDPKSKLERFTHVNVWVSTGPPPDDETDTPPVTPTRNPSARYLYTVNIKLSKITDPVVLRVDIRDANGTRKIYEHDQKPDDTVQIRAEGYGEQATFTIFYNGIQVSQTTKNADNPTSPPDTSNQGDNGDNGDNSGDNAGDNGNQDNGAGQ